MKNLVCIARKGIKRVLSSPCTAAQNMRLCCVLHLMLIYFLCICVLGPWIVFFVNFCVPNLWVLILLSFGKDPNPTVSKPDAGSDDTPPASCVDIPNRQSTYSCGCPMYGACQNNVFCGLFCSATLAIRCRSKAPFVHERLKIPNTSPQAVEPDP